MPLWGDTDVANSSPIYTPAQLGKAPTRANANTLYGNTTANSYVVGQKHTVLHIEDAEMNSANASSEAKKAAMTGWVLRTEGSGGRANRVQYEVLVAGTGGAQSAANTDDTFLP